MKAVRWFLWVAVCFAVGAGGAFALQPPTDGIPVNAALDLRNRLAKIDQYASEGRCEAVQGQLEGAQAAIDRLPRRTEDRVVQALQSRLDAVASATTDRCRAVRDEQRASEAEEEPTPEETEPTTPPADEEPAPTPEPEPSSPDPGANDGGPDPGSTETPTEPQTPPAEQQPSETESGGGGATVPSGAALRQQVEREARRRLRDAIDRGVRDVRGGLNEVRGR